MSFGKVPADMVVNATLATMAKHGRAAEGGMHVYHVASSTVNPLVFGDLSRFLFQHFTRSPYSDAAGQPIAVPPMRLFDTMEQFASYVETDALLRSARAGVPAGERLSQRLQELCVKSVEQTIHLGSIYQPYTFYTGRSSLSLPPMAKQALAHIHVSFICCLLTLLPCVAGYGRCMQVRQWQHGGAHGRDVGGGEGGVPLRREEHRLDGLHHQRPHPGAQEARHEREGHRRGIAALPHGAHRHLHGVNPPPRQ